MVSQFFEDRVFRALIDLDHARSLLRGVPVNGTAQILASVVRRLETYAIRELRRQHGRQAVAAVIAAASAKRLARHEGSDGS